MTAPTAIAVMPGFDRCFDPHCTVAPTGAFVLTSGGLIVHCGVCDNHAALAARLRALAASARGTLG